MDKSKSSTGSLHFRNSALNREDCRTLHTITPDLGYKCLNLTHISLASFFLDIGKQCRPRSDAFEKKNVNVCLSGVIVWVLLTEIQDFKSAILDVIARLCELRPNKKISVFRG